MANSWTRARLGDCVDILTGFPFQSSRYVEDASAPRLLRGDNIGQGTLRWNGAKHWPSELAVEFERFEVREEDVILAMDRPWIEAGLKYAAVRSSDLPALLVQRVARLRGKPGLDTGFLRYLIGGPAFTEHVLAVQTGTAIPHISAAQIKSFEFQMPPLEEQRAIAQILGTLDDKIELNRRMSETLEAMARAHFKSWFVDFEPVRTKAERWGSGHPESLTNLFPDQFVDSPIGEIPSGWKVDEIGQIADVIDCLHSKKPERRPAGLPLLQLVNIRDDGLLDMSDTYLIDESDYRNWTSRMEASPGDCLITNVGRVGAVGQMPARFKAALGRNMTGIRCRPEFPSPTFLIECLLSDVMKEEIDSRKDAGTILDALNVRNIPKLRFVRPGSELLQAFERLCRPLRARMESLLEESATLAALRDAMLPKLIGGAIGIPAEIASLGGEDD